MLCPKCQREMVGFQRVGVALDRCEQCKAVWFDRHELDTYRGDRKREGEVTVTMNPRFIASEGNLVCPRCRKALEVGQLEGVEIDRCPECAGLFLDRDDLDRLEGLAGLRILAHIER